MRMRKKKNLASRLENCGDITVTYDGEKPDWHKIFGNDNPIHLEIGCGKGSFTRAVAQRFPEINFVAVEKIANVAVSAMEKAEEAKLKNVRFMVIDAELLENIFDENSIDRIYLNFSCPYPKRRYIKHRLTYSDFLARYKFVLPDGGTVLQKTDNSEFFDFSVKSFTDCGWTLKNICHDLHASEWNESNIVTEYEEKFSAAGLPIYSLTAINNK